MTDNRTTELLPCPFCGGEAETHEVTFPYHYWDVWCDGECFDHFCEKPTEAEAIATWNARAERGTLTADDIRDLIERHSDESGGNGRDFHNGAYVAIADELNARAGRTCEIESSYLNDFTVKNMCWYEFEMKCGGRFSWDEMEPPKFCPNCGAQIVDKRELMRGDAE